MKETKNYECFETLFKEANLNFIDFDVIVGDEEMGYTYCGDSSLKLKAYGKELFKNLLSAPCRLETDSLGVFLPTCIIEGVSAEEGTLFFAAAAGHIADSEYQKIFSWA